MANILYRVSQTSTLPVSTSVKNLPLTNLELDANFRSIAIDLDTKAKAGKNADITSLTGMTTALSVGQGGTGASNFSGLLKGNGVTPVTTAQVGVDYAGPTSALATGILKSTTGTGIHTIAIPSDFPTLNQNTTGNAATASSMAYSGLTGTAPTWNQDTTGTAGNALRFGGLSVSDIQPKLGFTPIQQGGGTGQGTNKLYIGWATSMLNLQVDSTNYSNSWPINITGNATYTAQRQFDTLAIANTACYLSMNSTVWGIRNLHHNSGNMGFLKSDGNWGMMNDNGGSLFCPGNIVAYWSDKRLKKNITSKKSVGDIIDAFRVVEYDWDKSALDHYGVNIEAKKHQTGLIAQEAQSAFPNSVVINKSAELTGLQIENGDVSNIPKDDPLLTIDWNVITPLILKETQDLRIRMRDLEAYNNNRECTLFSMLDIISGLSKEIAILKAAK